MTTLNRRDVGYTIISRLESEWRSLIAEYYITRFGSSQSFIPEFITNKAQSKVSAEDKNDITELLDGMDFPDLSEIVSYSNNFSVFIQSNISKKEFSETTSLLYVLRCKIAHVKGDFTSIDLDKLIYLTKKITALFAGFGQTNRLIYTIENNPSNALLLAMPTSFINNSYSKSTVPNNIPVADYEVEGGFVGREEDKKVLYKLLSTPKFPIITITGAGGVGKTSLALNLVKGLLNDERIDFDAIVWLSAKENMLSTIGIEEIEPSLKSYDDMLDTIIDVLGFEDETAHLSSTDEKVKVAELLFELSKNILVVVDNLETISDERIRDFLIDAPINVKFLITSRRGIGQVERRHNLLQMKEVEAIRLFRQIARDKKLQSLSQLNDEIIKAYVNKISCYPLAIKWVIGQVARGKDISVVVDSIQESTSDIAKFCFDQIFSDLPKNCRLILFALTSLDTAPSTGLLKYIVDLDNNQLEEAIEELIIVSLISIEHSPNTHKEVINKYSILSLTKSYLKHYLSQEPSIKSYLEHRIGSLQNMISANELAKKEYKYLLSNFGAVTDEEKLASMLLQAATQKQASGNFDSALEDCQSALSVAPRFSPIYRVWASILSNDGRSDEALMRIERAVELNNNEMQNWLIWGSILRKSDNLKGAAEKYEKGLALFPDEIVLLNSYGKIKIELKHFDEADKVLSKALNLESESTSRKQQLITLVQLSYNLIEWSDSLMKRKMQSEAEDKLLNALVYCKRALNIDANESSALTNHLRANLKLAQVQYKYKTIYSTMQYIILYLLTQWLSFSYSLLRNKAINPKIGPTANSI
ncbi:MAG: ATP-binding protein [Hymenobacter sp.]|nr:MAG: ATP-binding protein [Hymenobacter sp.]